MKMAFNAATLALCSSIIALPADAGAQESEKKDRQQPNIIVILLDDLGYSDLGCYGSEIETPHIDGLAENGIRYRQFYNNARSAPTRAALLTGLYPHQVGNGALGKVRGYPNYQGYTNENNIFIPEALKEAGYFSVMTGKWHLGYFQGVTPITRGFDRSLNAPVGGYYFSDDTTYKNNHSKVLTKEQNLYLNDEELAFDDPRLPAQWYTTHLWVDYGLRFIDEAIEAGKPFFWYLAHNAPHFPLQAPAETIAKYQGRYSSGFDAIRNARFKRQQDMGFFLPTDKLTPRNPLPGNKKWENMSACERDISDNRLAIYAAVIEEIDKSTGKLLNYLKEKGVLENTVIMLLSDNGGNAETGFPGLYKGENPGAANSDVFIGAAWADVANTPYFLYKHHGHEGGCNTPLIISYPNGIKKSDWGRIEKQVYGHVIDIMPTILELAGAHYPAMRGSHTVPPPEGISLLPTWAGQTITRPNPIIMEHEGNRMLRDGGWKIVREYLEPAWRLYNMQDDPTEMVDLSTRHPDILDDMVAKYQRMAEHTGVDGTIPFKVGKWYAPIEDYLKQKR